MSLMLLDHLDLPHEEARTTARILNDYDPDLHLERLPDGHPWLIQAPNRPYAVIHRPFGQAEYVVDSFPPTMLDDRLLGIVFSWDSRRFGKDLDKFDARYGAERIRRERLRGDEIEEGRDRMRFASGKKRSF